MSFFTEVSDAPKARNRSIGTAALVYAAFLVLLAVSQLFGFEEFLLLVESFWLPGGEPLANFLAGFIVVIEVFALPFLLRMRLTPLMRSISIVAGWLVPLVWLAISLWLVLTVNAVTNIGFLGTILAIEPSIATVLISVLMVGLAFWVSSGMWPGHIVSKR